LAGFLPILNQEEWTKTTDSLLEVVRKVKTTKSTIGELHVNNSYECDTLEDPEQKEKIPGNTCIPEGMYEVVIAYSPRYAKPMPRLLKVPNFEGILIHPGNTDLDTLGCILVGKRSKETPDLIVESRAAFKVLMDKLLELNEKGRIYIKIRSEEATV
jgi:hypothetical protein